MLSGVMLTIADIEPYIQKEFGSRLEQTGFTRLSNRKWIRSRNIPIREVFEIGLLKGGRYCPVWGFSSGFAPSFGRYEFRRQRTEKQATMDLIIDPVDTTGAVPPQAFGFITGADTQIPVREICRAAEYFLPLAFADFDRVKSVADFCGFFIERSKLRYRRFRFDQYLQHQLVLGFVLILMDQPDEGEQKIREFCKKMDLNFKDRILTEYVSAARSYATDA